jgi:molybdopterin/thiamine biosynthesis adenylyltransferase
MAMVGKFHHEDLYRGPRSLETLRDARITLCGAGALGSNLADMLVRQGFQTLRVIDRDRVEEHNVSTQIYGQDDVGARKVDVLRNHVFRVVGLEIQAVAKELSERTVRKLLDQSAIVVDAFDNSASRRIVSNHCRETAIPCLHAGLFADYGEVIWNENYRVPGDVGQDVCDYPLARNLVLLTASVASEALVRFLLEGRRQNWSITLGDFAIRPMEG